MSEQHDTQPWYRQFWPWFIISLPATAVVASLYTVSLAMRTTDSLIVDAADGMDIVAERHLAAERAARQLGLHAVVEIDGSSGALTATLVSNHEKSWPGTLEIEFSHPAFAYRDQTIELLAAIPDPAGNPLWTGHFVDVPQGRWYVVLRDGDNWRLNGTWSGASTLHLRPASDGDD